MCVFVVGETHGVNLYVLGGSYFQLSNSPKSIEQRNEGVVPYSPTQLFINIAVVDDVDHGAK